MTVVKGYIKATSNMKTVYVIFTAILAGISLIIMGCGGAGSDTGGSTRGEGTIPIGKISSRPIYQAQIMATYQNGVSYSGTVISDGTVYMAPLPYGDAKLTVAPVDEKYEAASYDINVKAQQRYIISIAIQKKDPAVTIDSLSIEIPNAKEMEVGKTYPIKVTVNGKNAANLKPTVWVNGGAGSVDSGNRFLAMVPGEASIHAKIGDVETSIPITIY